MTVLRAVREKLLPGLLALAGLLLLTSVPMPGGADQVQPQQTLDGEVLSQVSWGSADGCTQNLHTNDFGTLTPNATGNLVGAFDATPQTAASMDSSGNHVWVGCVTSNGPLISVVAQGLHDMNDSAHDVLPLSNVAIGVTNRPGGEPPAECEISPGQSTSGDCTLPADGSTIRSLVGERPAGTTELNWQYQLNLPANQPPGTYTGGQVIFTATAEAPPAARTPENIVAPQVSPATPRQEVTESVTQGTWENNPTSYSYQWEDCDGLGENCTSISGATSSEYTPLAADVGHTLKVKVTASNTAGSATVSTGTEEEVLPSPPANTFAPHISPVKPEQGISESVTNGTWTNSPTIYSYQWQRCDSQGENCKNIDEATESSYLPTADDVGFTLSAQVTATNAGGSQTANALPTEEVRLSAPSVGSPPPQITGSTEEGQTLSTTTGTFNGGAVSNYTYEWQDCNSSGEGCVDIPAASEPTYTLNATDVGHTILVTVIASNTSGSAMESSSPTAIISGPPVNTEPPALSSNRAVVGVALNTSTGTWTEDPTSYSYQWQRCDSNAEKCVSITGATSSTYTPVGADATHTLLVEVTATNQQGSKSATSSPTGIVGQTPENTEAPSISSENPVEGIPLSVSNGKWVGTPESFTYTYQWLRCASTNENCLQITGASSSTYTPTAADVGHTLLAEVTATNTAGENTTSSSPTNAVLPPAPVDTQLPALSPPTPQQGVVESTTNGTWSNSPTSFTYQWEDCNSLGQSCLNITGATNSSYTPADTDVGGSLRIIVTANNAGGSASATSAFSNVVLPAAPVNTVAPAISSLPQQGSPSTVTTGTWQNAPTSFRYQWEQCNSNGEDCSSIPGGTTSEYTPVAEDVGHTLIVRVTAENAGGSESQTSAHSLVVLAPVGSINEYTLPSNSDARAITLGPDKNLWTAQTGNNTISKITPSGAITEYPLPSGSFPNSITSGPDGNLWYTDLATNMIGKITPSGAITEYPLPSGSFPYGITSGPDGNLWFTEEGTSKIGKITTSGAITEYPLPPSSRPYGITTGPDGNLWYVDDRSNEVGKITTSGAITEYPLPSGSFPNSITSGPDGNLWYTDLATYKIGKITTAGTITEYALPSGNFPYTITQGSDGNLWFTVIGSGSASKVEKITTAGTITEYALPSGSFPDGITSGAEGNIWFTEYSGVGDIAPGALTTVPINTVLPALSSSPPVQGVAESVTTGTWSNSPTSYTYQWQECNSSGQDCTPISGATFSSYTPLSSQVGKTLRVVLTAGNSAGLAQAAIASGTVASPAPVNSAPPTLSSSSPQQGVALSTSNGTWSNSPTSFTYQWEDCNGSGEACTNISGATSSSYTPVASDVGKTLRAVVAASNAGGKNSATSQQSNVVVPPAPINSVLPALSPSTPQQGVVESTTNGTWSNSPTSFAYQWEDCNSSGEACSSISGATSSSYTPVASDVGKTLRAVVTASNAGGKNSATSQQSNVVVPPAPTNTGLPSVSPTTPQQGMVELTTNGSWSNSPTSFTYQWKDCNSSGEACANISGATSMSYTPVAGDLGKTLRVLVSATNAGGTASAASDATNAVLPPVPVSTAPPSVSPSTPQQGVVESTTNGTWSNSPTSFTYQWEDCNGSGEECVYISGATSSSYTPIAGDVGHTLRAQVTASNSGGSESAISAATNTVLPPAPVSTAPPSVSPSTPQQGVVESTTNGTWSNSPTSFTYQWEDCSSSGESCTNISGATSTTYTPIAGDVGHTLRAEVTASNSGGSEPATSAATNTVLPAAPVNTALPTITSSGTSGWSAPQTIDGTNALEGISCTSSSFCVAVDTSGHILTSTNPALNTSWTATTISGAPAFTAVSCSPGTTATSGLCMAAAGSDKAYVATNPTGGASSWVATPTFSGAQPPSAVSCASSTLCVVTAGGQTNIGTISGTTVTWLDNSANASNFAGVSCTSTSFCAHIDSNFGVVYTTKPTENISWTGATGDTIKETNGHGLSCAPGTTSTSGLCVEVGANGTISTATNPSGTWTTTVIDGSTTLNSISCSSSSFCVAVDSAGRTLTSTSPTGGASAWSIVTVDSLASLTSVSCPSTTFCAAVDSAGDASILTGNSVTLMSASTGTWTNSPTSFTYQWERCNTSGEACVTISGATANTYTVGSADTGHTIRVIVTASNSGGSNSATSAASPVNLSHTQSIDSANSLTAASCIPTISDCVLGDSKGNAFYSTAVKANAASTWTTWAGPGPSPSEAVSCPATSLCVLADAGSVYYATSLGGAWTLAFSPSYPVVALSCSSSSFCIDGQGDEGGYIRYSTSPTSSSWNAEEVAGSTSVTGVYCTSSSFCAAITNAGYLRVAESLSQIESEAWTGTDIDGTTALNSISCLSTTSCLVVDTAGNVLALTVSGTGAATVVKHNIDSTTNLTSIACTTSSNCVAVDTLGNVFVSTNAGSTWIKEYALGTDLTSVACSSASLCVTTSTSGSVTALEG